MDSAIEGKYGLITASRKKFYQGEPVFLLRATDPLAVDAIKDYAEACFVEGCGHEHVEAVMEHAERIREWQKANPGLVKKLPD